MVDEAPARRPVAYPYDDERMRALTRGFLVVLALGFATVFGIAVYLNPYQADGSPKTMGTHQGLGLPPCNMVQLIGKPCPSCGMTTSFSLLMHGDPVNSVKANWAGTVLAAKSLAAIRHGHSGQVTKRDLVRAVECVADRLGNTKAVCRKSYIHPAVIDAYLEGETIPPSPGGTTGRSLLSADERAVLALLERRARQKKIA